MIQKEVHFPSDTALFYDALYQLAATGDWHYTEHALERMTPRTLAVMAELEKRALKRAVKEGYLEIFFMKIIRKKQLKKKNLYEYRNRIFLI